MAPGPDVPRHPAVAAGRGLDPFGLGALARAGQTALVMGAEPLHLRSDLIGRAADDPALVDAHAGEETGTELQETQVAIEHGDGVRRIFDECGDGH